MVGYLFYRNTNPEKATPSGIQGSRRGGVHKSRRGDAWKSPGGGQQEGEKTTQRYHTPDDPKGVGGYIT